MSVKVDVKVKGRRSIHRDEDDSQLSTDSTAAIHGSQEDLCDESSYEDVYEDNEQINNSSSSTSKRVTKKRSIPTIRTRSPNRPEPARIDTRNATTKESSDKRYCTCVRIISFFILVLALWTWQPWNAFGIGFNPTSEKNCTYSDLQRKYPKETDYLWRHLKSGIEDILNDRSDKPGVYLFLHENRKLAKQLIRDIATASSLCFNPSMRPVEIESIDFTSEDAVKDYGYVIEKYKKITKKGNVILIANLNEIPAEVARSLHTICDTESPIVRKVVIFLSLVAKHKEGRVIDTALQALEKLWEAKLDKNELDPLLTRVTDQVILLKSN